MISLSEFQEIAERHKQNMLKLLAAAGTVAAGAVTLGTPASKVNAPSVARAEASERESLHKAVGGDPEVYRRMTAETEKNKKRLDDLAKKFRAEK